MNAILDFVKNIGLDAIVGIHDEESYDPYPDISMYGSFIFDNDTVAMFDDGSQILI